MIDANFISDVANRVMEKLASTAMERYILRGGKDAVNVYNKAWHPYWQERTRLKGGYQGMQNAMMEGADNRLKAQQGKGIVRNVIEDMPNSPVIPKEDMEAAWEAAKNVPDIVELANLKAKARFTGDPKDHAEYVKRIAPYKDMTMDNLNKEMKYFTEEGRKKYFTGPKMPMGQTVPVLDDKGIITGFDIYTGGGKEIFPDSNMLTKSHESSEANIMKKYIGKPWTEAMYDLYEVGKDAMGTHAGIAPLETDRRNLLRMGAGSSDLYNMRYGTKPGQKKFKSFDDMKNSVSGDQFDQMSEAMRMEHAEYKNRTGHSIVNWRPSN